MTSTTTRVSKTVVTRTALDIDPKVAVAAVLALVADLILVVLFLAGRIDAGTLAVGVGPSSVAVLGAYVKRSTHLDPTAIAAEAHDVLEAAEPVIDAVAPAAAPVVQVVDDGVTAIQAQLQAPVPAGATLPPV